MKEFIDKLISRLEEEKKGQEYLFGNSRGNVNQKSIHKYALQCYELTISIVNELAEEYKGGWISVDERLPNKEEYLKDDGRFIVTHICIWCFWFVSL